MGRINRANLKKTIYYLKRNGLRKTWYAARERLEGNGRPPYAWIPPSEEELASQRRQWEARGFSTVFSILVPAYRTKAEYLRELIDSLRCQTYPKWELILADASEDDSVERVLRDSREPGGDKPDARIRYIRLAENAGISGNTNQALPHAAGDYVGLLDHDDILTPDALYEMAQAIEEGRRQGRAPKLLYSDEDKCNGDRTEYYEPNCKEDFNLDLLLSNNYICHFLVMDRKLIQKLQFRYEFDGAQDYDLVLRAVAELVAVSPGALEPGAGTAADTKEDVPMATDEKSIIHIPRVLYHWRCHAGSTAENPESKRYAYEAGRRAVQDFADRQGWAAKAEDTAHRGFYGLRYEGDIFDSRPDLGAVGGRLVQRGKICGGRLTREGRALYEGLPVHYSGYLHRAVLSQDAEAVDLRNIKVRPECQKMFRQITGVSYRTVQGTDIFDASLLPEDSDIYGLSLKLCEALRREGYRILYLPERTQEIR